MDRFSFYVTNIRAGRIEVYDTNFHAVSLGGQGDDRAFRDEEIPQGFAPFNVQEINGNLYVTYAKQNATKHDDFGYTSYKLIYNPVSEMVIVEMHGVGGEHLLPTRLFVRHKDAEGYQQIGDPDETQSYDQPVIARSQWKLHAVRPHGGCLSLPEWLFDIHTGHLAKSIDEIQVGKQSGNGIRV